MSLNDPLDTVYFARHKVRETIKPTEFNGPFTLTQSQTHAHSARKNKKMPFEICNQNNSNQHSTDEAVSKRDQGVCQSFFYTSLAHKRLKYKLTYGERVWGVIKKKEIS